MDATLLANKLVNSTLKQKKAKILCKLDIEKTYDHVNWNFLLKILKDMGFGIKWIGWINNCISGVKFSLLMNGNTEGFFQYPMSLFLFLIATEGLNHMFRKVKTNGWERI